MAPKLIPLMSSGSKKKEPRYTHLSEANGSYSQRMCSDVSSSAPHILHSGLPDSPIRWRCLLRVLCPVRRPVAALDFVLLKDKNSGLHDSVVQNSRNSSQLVFWSYLKTGRSRDSSVGIATRYGLEGPGIESWCGDIFRTYPYRFRVPPSLLYNGYRVFPGGKGGRSVTLTTHPILVLRLRKSWAIPALTLWVLLGLLRGSIYLFILKQGNSWQVLFTVYVKALTVTQKTQGYSKRTEQSHAKSYFPFSPQLTCPNYGKPAVTQSHTDRIM
jgi:hypothetical protein